MSFRVEEAKNSFLAVFVLRPLSRKRIEGRLIVRWSSLLDRDLPRGLPVIIIIAFVVVIAC
jgi:hypothetical protein